MRFCFDALEDILAGEDNGLTFFTTGPFCTTFTVWPLTPITEPAGFEDLSYSWDDLGATFKEEEKALIWRAWQISYEEPEDY